MVNRLLSFQLDLNFLVRLSAIWDNRWNDVLFYNVWPPNALLTKDKIDIALALLLHLYVIT